MPQEWVEKYVLHSLSGIPMSHISSSLTRALGIFPKWLSPSDLSLKRRKTLKDSMAAVLILQGYLESLREDEKEDNTKNR